MSIPNLSLDAKKFLCLNFTMHEKPDFQVGDVVLVKQAYTTPSLIGSKHKVARVTENRVYLENCPHAWNTERFNINDSLEIVERATIPMDDTRSYLETITELGQQHG